MHVLQGGDRSRAACGNPSRPGHDEDRHRNDCKTHQKASSETSASREKLLAALWLSSALDLSPDRTMMPRQPPVGAFMDVVVWLGGWASVAMLGRNESL